MPGFTVTDEKFGVYGPFATLQEARKCAAMLDDWIITDENDIVIDTADRAAREREKPRTER